jgi:hypothetical protein
MHVVSIAMIAAGSQRRQVRMRRKADDAPKFGLVYVTWHVT